MAAGDPVGLDEHFSFPADLRAPAAARRRITAALIRAQRVDLLETAVLLASELVTNVVVHAGTEVGMQVVLDDEGLRIGVSDANIGPLLAPGSRSRELGEGGRGLALVHALADRWGTTHSRDRKTIWFTLGSGRPTPVAARPVGDFPAGRTRPVLLALGSDLQRELDFAEQLGELLCRLLDAVGGDAGRVWLAAEDGSGEQVVCVRGPVELLDRAASRLTVPLELLGRPLGRVEVVAEAVGVLGEEEAAWAQVLGARIALAAQLTRSAEAENARRGWAGFLAEASDLLAGSLDVSRTLALVCQLAVSRLASWAVVHLTDPAGGLELTSLAHSDEDEAAGLRERLGSYTLALRRSEPTGAAEAVHLDADAGVCVPLRARNRRLGYLTLMRPAGVPFRSDEVSVIVDLAQRSALAMDNARLFGEQLAVARALQSGLLPPQLPPPGELEFGACYHAAREDLAVGGDFYDVLRLSADEWVLAIGDVCGKGAEAAAVTGVARDVLRLLLRQGQDSATALRQLNDTLLLAEHGRFCTVAIARLLRHGACWLAQLHSAGHPPAALLDGRGGVRLVGSAGTLLGVVPSTELELPVCEVELASEHSLVLYTDGITERRRDSRQFGEQGLLAALRDCGTLPAQAVAGHLDRAAVAFADEAMRDDTAVLVARVPSDRAVPAVVRQRATRSATRSVSRPEGSRDG